MAMDKVLATDAASRYDDALMFAADFYAAIARLPMTPAAEEYMTLLTQRAVTPGRIGTVESTPVRGVPTHETPPQPMPRREANVPQLPERLSMFRPAPVLPCRRHRRCWPSLGDAARWSPSRGSQRWDLWHFCSPKLATVQRHRQQRVPTVALRWR